LACFRKDTTGNDNTTWLCAHELGQREVCALHSSTGFGLHARQRPGIEARLMDARAGAGNQQNQSNGSTKRQSEEREVAPEGTAPGRPDASG
jgi:hypothetical protein